MKHRYETTAAHEATERSLANMGYGYAVMFLGDSYGYCTIDLDIFDVSILDEDDEICRMYRDGRRIY